MRDLYHRQSKLTYWINRINADLEEADRTDVLKLVEAMQDRERAILWIIRCICAASARDLDDALGTEHTFERIALTKSQIKDFGLDHLKNPDPEVLKKLDRDPNKCSFMQENEDLFQIEIDALQRNPEKFKNLVLSAIDRFFDQRVYDAVMTEYSPQDIEKLVHEQIQFNNCVGGS